MTLFVCAVSWAMSLQLPDAPSFGRPNFKPRQPLPPWKQRSLPWEVVAANSCPSLPSLMKLVLRLVLRSSITTTPIPALYTSLFMKTIRAHLLLQLLRLLSLLLAANTMPLKPSGFSKRSLRRKSKLSPSRHVFDWETTLPRCLLGSPSNSFGTCFKDGDNHPSRGSVEYADLFSYLLPYPAVFLFCYSKLQPFTNLPSKLIVTAPLVD